MEASESFPLSSKSLKSEKLSQSSSLSSSDGASNQGPWSSKTPEKPAQPMRRTSRARNRGVALSVKEVREVAKGLRRSRQDRPQSSMADQVCSEPLVDSPVAKSKNVDRAIKLPEKYEVLGEFFNSMDSSIRLLRMKGSPSTFTNVSRKIECLTERRFSHSYLAQLKFILPEAIELKKTLTLDEQTSCTRPDLHITLNTDAIECDGKPKLQNGSSYLRKVFRNRLLDFFKAHPEGNDIPEEMLPEPFNQSKQNVKSSIGKDFNTSLEKETSSHAQSELQSTVASHLPRSFCRLLSKIPSSGVSERIHHKFSNASLKPSILPVSESHSRNLSGEEVTASAAQSNATLPSRSPTSEKGQVFGNSQAPLPESCLLATPCEEIVSAKNNNCSTKGAADAQGTPAKLISTPAKLMTGTPAMQPPKRCCMSPDDYSANSPNKLVRRPPRSRSLKFDTPVKNARVEDEENGAGASIDNDIFDILPKNLLQSIRDKERETLEQDPAISQAKKRQKLIARLPRLFDMIHFLFQSIKRSVITKEELIHKIIACHCDIVDQSEVEEQLQLLQELVPEWISEKLSLSGDYLLCINKVSSPESIRVRLAEAK